MPYFGIRAMHYRRTEIFSRYSTFMKKRYALQPLLLLLLMLPFTAFAPPGKPGTIKPFIHTALPASHDFGTQWTSKIFPLIALFEAQDALQKALREDATLHALCTEKITRAKSQYDDCSNMACIVKSLQWQPTEVTRAGDALVQLLASTPALQDAIKQLRQQHAYPLYELFNDSVYLRKAWQDATAGMNQVLAVYLQGMPPRYPKIDSISFYNKDHAFIQKAKHLVKTSLKSEDGVFYQLPLRASIAALELNGRDEAVRYEPITRGDNRKPYEALKKTNWNDYTYSAIVVPGLGPEKPGVSLDSNGAKRCILAAARYQKHLAPFIIVSGGHVHPFKTPFAEAVEMKKYLVHNLGIPDAAVFIEPYARHTTTNLRNAARMWYTFGLPAQKPMLIVSDVMQSLYIGTMAGRCKEELGYVPYEEMHKVGKEETTFMPLILAMQPDPMDPLDP